MNEIMNLSSVGSATMRVLVAAGSALGAAMVPAQTDGYDNDYALIADSSLPAEAAGFMASAFWTQARNQHPEVVINEVLANNQSVTKR